MSGRKYVYVYVWNLRMIPGADRMYQCNHQKRQFSGQEQSNDEDQH